MSPVPARYRRRRRKTRLTREVAVCVGLRQSAHVARRQLRTADYPTAARERLGEAVTIARTAAGYPTRGAFAQAAGISKRSLVALEQGTEGIGQRILFAVANVLPGWTEETPRAILEGGPIPEIAKQAEPLIALVSGQLPGQIMDISHLPRDLQRQAAREILDILPKARQLGDDVYALLRDRAMEFVHRYGGPDEKDQAGASEDG